jgi:small subunit ribosomal protein S20
MPITKSGKKRLRQNIARRTRNRAAKSAVKTQLKRVLAAITAGDREKIEGEYRLACKKLDKAAAAGVIHRNTASRHKSRLSARIKGAGQTAKA